MATKVKSFRLDKDKEKFIQRALDWYDIIQKMIAFGSIKEMPDIFIFPQHTIVPESHAVSEPEGIIPKERLIHTLNRAYLPPFVEDVLNGGSYPNPEDCTEEERDVLYNPMFQEHYKRYISTKDDKSRGLLRGIIAEFIEHNFPMLKKDTK